MFYSNKFVLYVSSWASDAHGDLASEQESITQNKHLNTIKRTDQTQMKIKKPESGNVVHTTSKNENKIFIEHSTKHKIPNGPKSQRTERNCDTNKIEKMHESTHYDTNEK